MFFLHFLRKGVDGANLTPLRLFCLRLKNKAMGVKTKDENKKVATILFLFNF